VDSPYLVCPRNGKEIIRFSHRNLKTVEPDDPPTATAGFSSGLNAGRSNPIGRSRSCALIFLFRPDASCFFASRTTINLAGKSGTTEKSRTPSPHGEFRFLAKDCNFPGYFS
jgi:hypothetical protein